MFYNMFTIGGLFCLVEQLNKQLTRVKFHNLLKENNGIFIIYCRYFPTRINLFTH